MDWQVVETDCAEVSVDVEQIKGFLISLGKKLRLEQQVFNRNDPGWYHSGSFLFHLVRLSK